VLTPEAGGVSVVAATIGRINEDIAQAQARRIEIEAVLRAAAEMKQRQRGLETLPQVMADGERRKIGPRIARRGTTCQP